MTPRINSSLGVALLLLASAMAVWGYFAHQPVKIALAAADFRILDVSNHDGQLLVEVEHFKIDGTFDYFENYLWQGREGLKKPRIVDADGFFLLADGTRAPFNEQFRQYLPEGQSWRTEAKPHLDRASILSVIQQIHNERVGWNNRDWPYGIKRGQSRLIELPVQASQQDNAGISVLVSEINGLAERAYYQGQDGISLAFAGAMPAIATGLGHIEYGTVSTFHPDGSPESSSVDGQATENPGDSQTWATIRGGNGNGGNDTSGTINNEYQCGTGNNFTEMTRGVAVFDAAALPDSDVITSATIDYVATARTDDFTDSISFVLSAPASDTAVAAGDFDSFGTTKQASDILLSAITVDSSTFTVTALNSTGLSNISKTGITKFGTRLTRDNDDNEPACASGEFSGLRWASADEALSGDKRPRLVVTHIVVSAAVSGTIGDNATEQEVRNGAGNIEIALTNDTWVAAGGTFDAQRQAIIDGLDSAQSETNGWNAQVRDQLAVGSVARTSSTVVTITVAQSDVGNYRVELNEVITVTVPGAALVLGSTDLTASPTFTITAAVESAAVTGTLGGSGGVPSEIVAGGETVIITLTNTSWVDSGDFNPQRQSILDGLVSDKSDQAGWDSLSFAVGDVVRTSASVVTITLTAESGYAIPQTETITATPPASAMLFGAALAGAPTFALVPSFQTSGTRVSAAINLSAITDVAYCAFGWESTEPTNTTVAIATSMDGGTNYSDATNGSCPTGISEGASLLTVTDFRIRVTLTTTDTSATPLITALALIVEDESGQELHYELNSVPGYTISDRSGNNQTATMSFPVQTSGVSTSLGSMSSTDVPTTATALGIPEVAAAVSGSAVSSKIFTTTEDGSFLPGGGLVALASANAGIPARAIWQVLFSILVLVVSSVVVKLADNNLMWGAVALSFGIAFGALIGEDGIWPRWMIFIAPIPMMAMITLKKGVPM